ncbi:MAG TPA: sulfurtransferase complex subunit TusD [Pseudomonadales bacterium]|nr:sulfurtransferase complex subunit TusD [Pseudomonadales bacterium]
MRFCILVQGSPTSVAAATALNFTAAALKLGHEVVRVFFTGDSVGVARSSNVIPQDERDLGLAWSELAQGHAVDLVVCVSAALKRGVLDAGEANRYERPAPTLLPGFSISGLGQLVEASMMADRVVTFGA